MQVSQHDQIAERNTFMSSDSDGSHALLKTRKNYTSSSDSIPYSYISYTYDKNGNLIKKIISNYPGPPFALYEYVYSDEGLLSDMKYSAMEGMNSSDQTEKDFTLISEEKYSYEANCQIRKTYIRNVLEDTARYSYSKGHIKSESHNYLTDRFSWSMDYEYDLNGNKIKETSYPDSLFTIYEYDGKTLKSKCQFDKNGELIIEMTYNYTSAGDNLIVESHYKGPYGEYTFDKTTYKNGNMIEYVLYDHFKFGEWVSRYEYY
jgi:hypothetical protein